jgi:hypothetical protein
MRVSLLCERNKCHCRSASLSHSFLALTFGKLLHGWSELQQIEFFTLVKKRAVRKLCLKIFLLACLPNFYNSQSVSQLTSDRNFSLSKRRSPDWFDQKRNSKAQHSELSFSPFLIFELWFFVFSFSSAISREGFPCSKFIWSAIVPGCQTRYPELQKRHGTSRNRDLVHDTWQGQTWKFFAKFCWC